MSLEQQVKHALAAVPLFSTGEHIVEVSEGDALLRCELVALDSLACSFHHLVLRADRIQQYTAAKLKEVAETLSQRLTYLLEPITPIETDMEGCVVQMRSNPPLKEED